MSAKQLLVLVALGAGLWLGAALAIRNIGPFVLDASIANVLLFLGFVPVALLLVFVCGRFANLHQKQLVEGIAVMVAAAILMDGIALTWWPDFYGNTSVLRERGAAALLWGAGATMAGAVLLGRS
jgi:hypothetical protein